LNFLTDNPAPREERRLCDQGAIRTKKLTFTNCSLAPYERRVIELLRNSKDKRARKLAKKRVRRIDLT